LCELPNREKGKGGYNLMAFPNISFQITDTDGKIVAQANRALEPGFTLESFLQREIPGWQEVVESLVIKEIEEAEKPEAVQEADAEGPAGVIIQDIHPSPKDLPGSGTESEVSNA
jgi:hypothetical protein